MTELIIEKAYIPCQVCGQEFWFEFENEIQECPHCGQRNYRKAIPLTIKRCEAGRFGGQTTFTRYGSEGMRDRAKLGGRHRLPTLTELRQNSASSVPLHLLNENKRRKLPNGLPGLKALYKLQKNNNEGEA